MIQDLGGALKSEVPRLLSTHTINKKDILVLVFTAYHDSISAAITTTSVVTL